MTLFISERNQKKLLRNLYIYLGVIGFCILFGVVYEIFSHEVFSFWMAFGFLFPVGGLLLIYVLPLIFKKIPVAGAVPEYTWNCAVATLTVGSLYRGVLEIFGSPPDHFYNIYIVVGTLGVIGALVTYIIGLLLLKKHNKENMANEE